MEQKLGQIEKPKVAVFLPIFDFLSKLFGGFLP